MFNIFFASVWIETTDLWNWKQPLFQLSHNHCPVVVNWFLTFGYLFSWTCFSACKRPRRSLRMTKNENMHLGFKSVCLYIYKCVTVILNTSFEYLIRFISWYSMLLRNYRHCSVVKQLKILRSYDSRVVLNRNDLAQKSWIVMNYHI